VFAIPFGALLIIGLLAFGFAQVLLNLESKEAATTIAIVMAANVLAACAFAASRRTLGRSSMVELALVALYPVVVGIAIAATGVIGGEAHTEVAGEGAPEPPPAATGGVTTEIVAADIAWSEDTMTLKAEKPNKFDVVNEDTTVHNLSIYKTPEDAETQTDPLFEGPDVAAGATEPYEVDALPKGEYAYICDYHINMQGTLTAE
jgi:plastocyanin